MNTLSQYLVGVRLIRDVLTESVVRNFANEDQTITIFDPNTGRRATVPTSPRGRPRRVVQRPSFQASMN